MKEGVWLLEITVYDEAALGGHCEFPGEVQVYYELPIPATETRETALQIADVAWKIHRKNKHVASNKKTYPRSPHLVKLFREWISTEHDGEVPEYVERKSEKEPEAAA